MVVGAWKKCRGNHCFVTYRNKKLPVFVVTIINNNNNNNSSNNNNWRASETLSGLFNRESQYICIYIYSETSINDHSEKRPNSLQRPNYLPPIHPSIELMYF